MSDPRLGTVVSVVKSETTSDLKHCKIFVSIIGDEAERDAAMVALGKAAGFIRGRVAHTINLRQTPEIKFEYCDSIEHGMKMRKLIEEVNSSVPADTTGN
jgi:ribosome-binding factor A